MLGAETSRTPPSQKTPLLTSVLKLLRKRKTTEVDGIVIFPAAKVQLLMVDGSGQNASLGEVSGLTSEVTQQLLTQFGGRAGGITSSKFSIKTI
jgi:hypothetical protein